MVTIHGPSETIAHDAYTIRELLEKFTTNDGYPVKNLGGTFEENVHHQTEARPDAPDFDLTDAQTIKDESQLTIDKAIQENKEIESKKAQQKEDEIFEKKLQKHQEKNKNTKQSDKDEKPILE